VEFGVTELLWVMGGVKKLPFGKWSTKRRNADFAAWSPDGEKIFLGYWRLGD
jgi:hypothetical protein